MTDLTKEIKETTDNKLNCKWEDGEKKSLKDLSGQLESLKDQKDILQQNINVLGNQKLPEKEKSLKDFLETDVKGKLVSMKANRDKKSEESKTVEAANQFVQEVANELQTICGNNSDIVMALQIYVNGLNDLQGQHATIPYNADRYGYKSGDTKRLFIDGFLGPHTYNALWLAVFKEEMPQVKKDVIGYIKEDGTVYLPGKDGKYKPFLVSKEGYSIENGNKELPSEFQKLNLFLEFYEIYKDAALKVAGSRNKLNSSWGSDEGAEIKTQIAAMDKEITNAINLTNKGNKFVFDSMYRIVFAKMNYVEKELETVLGQDDLKKTQDLFKYFDGKNYKNTELQILDINRRKFGDAMLDSIGGDGGGNSDAVKEKLMERILERNDFVEINKLLSNPNTMKDIINGKTDKLQQKLQKLGISESNAKDIINQIFKQYSTISSKNIKERNQFTASIESQVKTDADKQLLIDSWNQNHPSEIIANQNWDDYLERATDFMIKESTNSSTLITLQELMIKGKIQTMFDNNQDLSKDKELYMMKDILGVGFWDVSDNNLDYIIEAGQTIALSAVTMGAGAIAAKLALSAVKYGSTALKATKRGTRIVSGVDKLSKGGKVAKGLYNTGKLVKRGVKTGVEGLAFYEGSNITTNVILPDRSLFENVGDRKEIAKSAAFVGVLQGLGKAFSALKLGGNAKTFINTNGLRFGAPKAFVGKEILQNTGKILVQGGILTGTSQGLEFVFSGFNGEAWNPTWEEFIQACLLSRMMEGAGKLPEKVKVRKRGKTIEIVDGGKDKGPDKNGKGKDKGQTDKGGKEQEGNTTKKTKNESNSEELNSLKSDKRAYLEKQREINGKIKDIENSKSYKEKISNDVQKIQENSRGVREEVAALERRIANHKDQIKLLENSDYKAKNALSDYEAKTLIESNAKDISILEKQLTPKKEILNNFDNQIKLLDEKMQLINHKQVVVNEEIAVLETKINNHKEMVALLENSDYKAANAISDYQAKDLIKKNNESISELEQKIIGKKGELLKIEKDFANQDIKNLRLDRLKEARHIDDINVIIKNEIVTNGGKEFSTKTEAESFFKRNSSLLKKGAIIIALVGGSLLAYKAAKGSETEMPNITEVNPDTLSDQELTDSVTINNNDEFVPTISE